jgi:uncharacterized membrane protein (DUF485 family)
MRKWALVLCVFAFCRTLYAQEKHALVIGNGDYTALGKLKNPVNDAEDVAAVLNDLGFNVEVVFDGDRGMMETAFNNLINRLSVSKNSYGFLYYAGHGVQSNGMNYLIPVDANIPSSGYLSDRTVPVNAVLNDLSKVGNELNVVVLDACRDNPFNWARSGTRGLTVTANQPDNSIIVYATSAGSVAQDGEGRNGLFTSHLLNNLKTPGLEVKEIFNRTGADVAQASNRQQIPVVSIQFFENAYFDDNAQAVPRAERPPLVIQKPIPQPLPAQSKSAVVKPVGYGFMNLALGLGSYLQGDITGGAIVTGGYVASIALIAWELNLTRADAMAGYVGPVGVVAGIGTLVFGFVKPFVFNRNRLASANGDFDIALVSSGQKRSALALTYTRRL